MPDESDSAEMPFDEQPTLREETPGTPDATPRSSGSGSVPAAGSHIMGTIGDFEVVEKLGQGGMGAVYRARQISLGRMVALKILPAQFEEDEDFVSRFQREARLAASLHHPNLVRVYASGQADGSHYIAMELVEGETLSRRVKRGALPQAEAVRVCLDVARALQCGWQSAQLIHRDIKPSNIYLSHAGEVKLGDLGLAKSLLGNTTGLTHTGTMMGTPHYISPEQARGDKTIDFRTDIYSLGCTLYQCLTGQTPYVGTDPLTVMNLHLSGPPPAILKALPGCPIPLARLVGKMLKKQRHERHQSYEELIEQLESVLTLLETGPLDTGAEARLAMWREVGGGPSAAPASVPSKPHTGAKSKAPLYAGIAATVLVVAGISWLLTQRPAKKTPAAAVTSSPRPPPAAARPTATPPLDGAGADPATAAPYPVGQWKKIVFSAAEATQIGASLNAEGELKIKGGISFPGILARDLAIRGELRQPTGVFGDGALKTLNPHLRVTAAGSRVLALTPRNAALQTYRPPDPFSNLGQIRYPAGTADPGAWVSFHFATVGKTSLGAVGGHLFPPVASAEVVEPGSVRFGGEGSIRNLEVLILDGLPEAEALKRAAPSVGVTNLAAATKDAPFTNSLGMKFVPVPITGGPTGGQRVLFSIWETRVQDYETFVAETRNEWPKPDFEQRPDHPAVNVNWDDAQAFCTWLTEHERTAGKLGSNERYRLPSDHEWSSAVGIGPRENPAQLPVEKQMKITDTYPWGAVWPPPANAGNFGGEESAIAIASPDGILSGWRDDFAATAPVGTYPANRFGLFDLAGNAIEWCEDWFDRDRKMRVLRGSSWLASKPDHFPSSRRAKYPQTASYLFIGFRVVLAPAP